MSALPGLHFEARHLLGDAEIPDAGPETWPLVRLDGLGPETGLVVGRVDRAGAWFGTHARGGWVWLKFSVPRIPALGSTLGRGEGLRFSEGLGGQLTTWPAACLVWAHEGHDQEQPVSDWRFLHPAPIDTDSWSGECGPADHASNEAGPDGYGCVGLGSALRAGSEPEERRGEAGSGCAVAEVAGSACGAALRARPSEPSRLGSA